MILPGQIERIHSTSFQVSDGSKLWSYDPDLNQVAVKKLGTAFGASPAALLAGKDLDKHFELKDAAAADGIDRVKLRALARNGGVIQITYVAPFISQELRDAQENVREERERREREEFIAEGSIHLRDRFNSPEMWERLGIDPKDALAELEGSEGQVRFRKRLFSRIVPIIKDIGLWSPRVIDAHAVNLRDSDVDVGAYEFQGVATTGVPSRMASR